MADQFVERFGDAIDSLVVGPGNDPASAVGLLIDDRAVASVRGLVEAAVAEGATVARRAPVPAQGHFYPPTLLTAVRPGAMILLEKIFGPVAPVVVWTDEADLLRQVNDTELGLAAYVFAGRLQDALWLAERIEAGMVGINRGIVSDPAAPFGGMKQSGIGREGARDGIREFQEKQYYSVDLGVGR